MGDISGSFSMMMISVSSRGTGEKAITALVYGYLLFFSFFSSVFIFSVTDEYWVIASAGGRLIENVLDRSRNIRCLKTGVVLFERLGRYREENTDTARRPESKGFWEIWVHAALVRECWGYVYIAVEDTFVSCWF